MKTNYLNAIIFWMVFAASANAAQIRIDSAEATHNPYEASLAFDNNPSTRWTTGTPQAPEQSILFKLNQAANIRGLDIQYEASSEDGPAEFQVFITIDPKNLGQPVYSGKGLKKNTKIEFAPKYGNYVKLVQTASKGGAFWSIHEITLIPADTSDTFAAGVEPLDSAKMLFLDTTIPIEARLDILMELMTVREKLAMVAMGMPVERLKVPGLSSTEALHGLTGSATGQTTIFPQSIALGAAFDKKLAYQVSQAIGQETRAAGFQQAWSPVFDVCRDPRWGRCEETFGEDTCLVEEIGCAWVNGFQSQGVIATPKHFAGHGGTLLGGRDSHEIGLSERELREIHLPPFRRAVKECKVQSIMQQYAGWLGTPSTASKDLLNGILREEWGFDGFIVSDCYSVRFLCRDKHYIYGDIAQASQGAIEATIARNCGNAYNDPATIAAAEAGRIDIEKINYVVKSILRVLMKRGDFEKTAAPFDSNKVYPGWNSPQHQQLALEAARKAITLLRNENNRLPLKKTIKTIAVIGPAADNVQTGDYSAQPGKEQLISVYEALKTRFGSDAAIHYAPGCDFTSNDASGFAKAVEIAKAAEAAIVVVGDKSEGENKDGGNQSTTGENSDKAVLRLSGLQEELVKAIAATGTPVILVVSSGRPYTLAYADKIDAILYSWFGGQASGTAVADVLFGDYNPAGRLPVTLPKMTEQLPLYYNFIPSGRRYTYIDSDSLPQYRFGYGLSFTQFEYSNLRCEVGNDGHVKVSVDVKNIGTRPGEEVVQLYLTDMFASVQTRIMMLKGFDRVAIEPGRTATVSFKLTPYDLSLLNRSMDRVVEKGQFKVSVGGVSPAYGIKNNGDAVKDQMYYKDATEGLMTYFDIPNDYAADFAYRILPSQGTALNVEVVNKGNLTDRGELKLYIDGRYTGQMHQFELDPAQSKIIEFNAGPSGKMTAVGKYSFAEITR